MGKNGVYIGIDMNGKFSTEQVTIHQSNENSQVSEDMKRCLSEISDLRKSLDEALEMLRKSSTERVAIMSSINSVKEMLENARDELIRQEKSDGSSGTVSLAMKAAVAILEIVTMF